MVKTIQEKFKDTINRDKNNGDMTRDWLSQTSSRLRIPIFTRFNPPRSKQCR